MPAMDYSRVAELYDLYAQTDIDLPFFLRESHGCSRVLELTSGTGRLSFPLIRAGVPLTCVDNSPDMLAVLRRKLASMNLSAPIYEMDAVGFQLAEKFDLILIPFNSFAEFTDRQQQIGVLTSVKNHLRPGGKFICTLHNPSARLKLIDGQTRLRGKFPLPDGSGSLELSSWEKFDPQTCLVGGEQIYEIKDPQDNLVSKLALPISFYLHTRVSFEQLAEEQGFRVISLWGDYQYGPFQDDRSPFMIWALRPD
jgi:SAM-dependent methyltransferase